MFAKLVGVPAARKLTNKSDAKSSDDVMHKAWRLLAVTIGLGVLGAGAYAVFATNVEAGPVALIAVGFLLVTIGISGKPIAEVQFGDKKISWQREREAAQEFVEDVVDQVSTEQRPQTVSALEVLNDAAPEVAAPALRALLYENQIMAMLRQIQSRSANAAFDVPEFDLVQPTFGSGRPQVDALLVTPDQAGVVVEIKSLSRMTGINIVKEFEARIEKFKKIDQRARVGLLITRSQLTNSALYEIRSDTAIEHIWVEGVQEASWLEQAVRHALIRSQAMIPGHEHS